MQWIAAGGPKSKRNGWTMNGEAIFSEKCSGMRKLQRAIHRSILNCDDFIDGGSMRLCAYIKSHFGQNICDRGNCSMH